MEDRREISNHARALRGNLGRPAPGRPEKINPEQLLDEAINGNRNERRRAWKVLKRMETRMGKSVNWRQVHATMKGQK